MERRGRFAVPLVFVALTGCAGPSPDPGELDRSAIEAEITELSNAFWDAWRSGNAGLDQALAFFDDHPDFAYAAEGTLWHSFTGLSETFRSAFAVVQSQTVEIRATKITVLDRDLAYLTQSGTYAIIDMNGVASEERPFAFSGLWVRTRAGWKIRCAHESEPGG